MTERRYGRVIIDRKGIRQKPFLFFFGRPFELPWSGLTAWASVEQVLVNPRTGTTKVFSRMLELRTAGRIHYISRNANDKHFSAIVEQVRYYAPQLESESMLQPLRRGVTDPE